jgi:hypothetical protein
MHNEKLGLGQFQRLAFLVPSRTTNVHFASQQKNDEPYLEDESQQSILRLRAALVRNAASS